MKIKEKRGKGKWKKEKRGRGKWKERRRGGGGNEKKAEKEGGEGWIKRKNKRGREYAESHTIIRMFSSNGLQHVFNSC